MFFGIAKV